MNKNLLLAGGLVALAVIIYMRKNKKPISAPLTSVAPPKEQGKTPPMQEEHSNSCGACSGADGENWN